jgi:hypothetical protein
MARTLRFPSVRHRPLGHLSVFRIVHLQRARITNFLDCDTSANLARTLTGASPAREMRSTASMDRVDALAAIPLEPHT